MSTTVSRTSEAANGKAFRVVLADDHPVVANGVRLLLEQSGCKVVAVAMSTDSLLSALARTTCDILVTDFSMPGAEALDGLSLLTLLRNRWPVLPIVVLTQVQSPAVLRSIVGSGANAVVNKSDPLSELLLAVNAVLQGRTYLGDFARRHMDAMTKRQETLSRRESEVLRLYASGLSVKEISELLARSAKTISNQKIAAMEKLGIRSDLEIFSYASEHGMLP
ncbi:response regulator transcription factor [Lysobacter panacisoli]|uniref:Response regulator n=1 Tax=Lysobacter panacisoli TaxID=1255263 RepID=A0ABP9L691_9GAMM|nr:response regulator transcription factor [Lysobacter panacisoli]